MESDSKFIKNLKIYSERIAIIVVITIVAIVVPRFVDFLNISGSLGSSALGFVFPPLYYFQCYGINNISTPIICFNVFIILLGVGGGSYSIYNSIYNLVNGG